MVEVFRLTGCVVTGAGLLPLGMVVPTFAGAGVLPIVGVLAGVAVMGAAADLVILRIGCLVIRLIAMVIILSYSSMFSCVFSSTGTSCICCI